MPYEYEATIINLMDDATRRITTRALILGGIQGSGGGIGGPPGGFVGYLPQTRIAYDLSELASSGTATSGSLLDNLNHIRYRIEQLETVSGVTVVNFLDLTDSPDSYVGQAGKSVVVNATEDGLEFTTISGGTTISGYNLYEDLDSQVNGITDHFDLAGVVATSGFIQVFYNGIAQDDDVVTVDVDGTGFTLDFVPANGDNLAAEYNSSNTPVGESSGTELTNSNISPTTANVNAEVNYRYFADISGLTADRNFVVPAGAVGDIIELCITVGDATYELVIIGDTSITINGGSAATEWSRLFITGESIKLVASSTTNWQVIYDGRLPCIGEMTRITTDITTNTANTQTTADWNSAPIDVGSIADLTNNYFVIRRANKYVCEANFVPAAAMTALKIAGGYLYKNASQIATVRNRVPTATVANNVHLQKIVSCAVGDTMLWKFLTEETDKGLAKSDTAGAEGCSFFNIREIIH